MIIDSLGIRKERVGRHKRSDGGKKRQQTIEYDSRGDRQKTIFIYLIVRPPKNILPALFPGMPVGDIAWRPRPGSRVLPSGIAESEDARGPAEG